MFLRDLMGKQQGGGGDLKYEDLNQQEKFLYNVHLNNLRNPVKNPDGSLSTLKQTTFEEDGKTYNIPTIWNGAEHDPNVAWARAKKIGLANFPSYKSEAEAEARYSKMHKLMEQDVIKHLQAQQ